MYALYRKNRWIGALFCLLLIAEAIAMVVGVVRNLPDEQLVASSRLLLSNMADAGNMAAKNHVGMVEEVERVLQSVAQNVVYPIDHDISMVSSFEMDIYDWIQSTGFGSEFPVSSQV